MTDPTHPQAEDGGANLAKAWFNLAGLDAIQRSLIESSLAASSISRSIQESRAAQTQLISKVISLSIDFEPLEVWRNQKPLTRSLEAASLARAISLATNLDPLAEANSVLAKSSRRAMEARESAWRIKAPSSKALEEFIKGARNWKPTNLTNDHDIHEVARIALDEGIPLAWVPRAELVTEILAAHPEDRPTILLGNANLILDDCAAATSAIEGPWMGHFTGMIGAYRAGFSESAQAHSVSVADSILLQYTRKTSDHRRAISETQLGDVQIRVFRENLTLRPVCLAYARWFPSQGEPHPTGMNRNMTTHHAGRDSVYTQVNSLISIMFAASLARQYARVADVVVDDGDQNHRVSVGTNACQRLDHEATQS